MPSVQSSFDLHLSLGFNALLSCEAPVLVRYFQRALANVRASGRVSVWGCTLRWWCGLHPEGWWRARALRPGQLHHAHGCRAHWQKKRLTLLRWEVVIFGTATGQDWLLRCPYAGSPSALSCSRDLCLQDTREHFWADRVGAAGSKGDLPWIKGLTGIPASSPPSPCGQFRDLFPLINLFHEHRCWSVELKAGALLVFGGLVAICTIPC